MPEFISSDPVAMQARLRPTALAAIDLASDRRWSYRALDADIQRAVTVLMRRDVVSGERVAVIARNSVFQLVLQMALMRLGAIFVPVNWRLAAPEQARLIDDCAPVVVYSDDHAPDLPPGCRLLGWRDFALEVDAAEAAPRHPIRPADEACVILYTSGTSGAPKGALLTAQSLLATAVNFAILGEVDRTAVFLCDSPMFHVIGLVTQFWPPLMFGGTVVVSSGFEPADTNRRLADPALGITHYFCVPQMAEALRQAETFAPSHWRTLKALFTGGAQNPPARIRWWLDNGIRMVDGYGMTEAGTILGMPLSADILRDKAGAVGVPGPLTAVRLVDAALRDVPDGVPGEILVFGPNVTPGYWNRPKERLDSFTPDGWFRTGDIGCRDADGFITIVDRRKDMFISGGENVYPIEIEAVLMDHPAVREAAVIGVVDARWGEAGLAYVVVAPGSAVTADDLARHVRVAIARYKVPREFRFVDSLPRTGSGKVMKHALRQAAQASD